MNIKENEKTDKYLDLAKVQKKMWNIWVTVIPITIDVLLKVLKGSENGE